MPNDAVISSTTQPPPPDDFKCFERLSGKWRVAILTYLRDHGECSARELMDGLETTRQQLERPLVELRAWGWITASVRQPELRPIRFRLNDSRIQEDLSSHVDFLRSLGG